jgi:hypothetical protein
MLLRLCRNNTQRTMNALARDRASTIKFIHSFTNTNTVARTHDLHYTQHVEASRADQRASSLARVS